MTADAADRRSRQVAEPPLIAGLMIVAAAPQILGHPLDKPSALLVAERRVVVADRRHCSVVVRPSPLRAIAGPPNARAPSHYGYRAGTSADRRAGTPALPQSRGDRGGRVLRLNAGIGLERMCCGGGGGIRRSLSDAPMVSLRCSRRPRLARMNQESVSDRPHLAASSPHFRLLHPQYTYED